MVSKTLVTNCKYIQWSPDSQYILCALYQHSTIQVFSLHSPDWKCKLRHSVCGIVDVCWSPDSRHILTTAEFHVSICIWSLVSHTVKYITCVKETTKPCFSFSSDGSWLAVVEDQGDLDCISIFSASWKLRKQISCVGLGRIEGFSWTPDASAICVWKGAPDKCQLQVYEISTGELRGNFQSSESRMCGIKAVAWMPSDGNVIMWKKCKDTENGYHWQYWTFYSEERKPNNIRLLNHITWQPMVEFPHSDILLDKVCTVYQESFTKEQPSKISFELIHGRPVIISSLQMDLENPTKLMGTGLAVFSSCGYFLATRADKMPAALWIWSIKEMALQSVIVHKQPVTAICWAPVEPRLAIVSGSNFVSLWVNKKVMVHMTDQLCVSDVRWDHSGECLALCATTKVAFLQMPAL
ncbi:WD repeat-containing protein WRAP73 isoform X3 [Cryptotermes secundus]|uniref:WD repeat-containing protein WRAP73 isoform X3 n=1 Tax=Cryptotermes secundus TaxID=105785 RepID=UPI000CD7CB18|nr:WD repeat-containing protein WRAP73 isoform X3 [Cryptotermes secundus]